MDIFTKKLQNHDLVGALDVAILEAENAKKLAQDALKEMEERQKRMEFEDIHRVLGDLLDDRPADFQLLLLKNLREMRAEMKASETVNTLTKKQVNEINNCLEQSGIVGRL